MKKFLSLIFMCAVIGTASSADQMIITQDGKSLFTLVVPSQSNPMLDRAAQELQKCIYLASKVKLVIRKDDQVDKDATNIISLGFTRQAIEAGINTKGLTDDGYRIVTRDHNLYIIGYTHLLPRSAGTPAEQLYKRTGSSTGTANGIYSFLEDYLHVRWLMPGDLGRIVPANDFLTIPDNLNISKNPAFRMRMLTQGQEWLKGPAEWQERQRIFFQSARIQHNHSWDILIPPSIYAQHPEWFALVDGKRVKPVSTYKHKFETTNPELIRYFADQVIKKLKADKESETQSISPTDMHGWSESPASKKLYDPAPENSKYGPDYPSVTPLVLQFYRDVAATVKKEYPQGRLAGYFYGDYLFPPKQGGMDLPNNFVPVIAPNTDYGFKLYKKTNQETFEYVMNSWMKVFPKEWYYYDLPNVFLQGGRDTNYQVGNMGVIAPPGVKILDYIFPYLVKHKASGVLLYGANSWSSGALTNYILARMMWNPQLKASDLQKEWLTLAYGKEAGAAMNKFYQELENIFIDYSEHVEGIDNWFEDRYLKNIYSANFDRLKKLFDEAQRSPMDKAQHQRFELIKDNFTLLEWRLQNIGSIQSEQKISDKTVDSILHKEETSFMNFPLVPHRNLRAIPNIKVKVSSSKDAPESFKKLPSLGMKQTYLLFASKDGIMRLFFSRVSQGSYFTSYLLRTTTNPQIIEQGLLYNGANIEIPIKKNTAYYLIIPSHSKAMGYQLTINDTQIGKGEIEKGTLNLQEGDAAIQLFTNATKEVEITEDNGNVIITKKPTQTDVYWDQD